MDWLGDFVKTVSLMELLQMHKEAKKNNDTQLLIVVQEELRNRDQKELKQ